MNIGEQIEHLEHFWSIMSDKPWQNLSKSRKKDKKLHHRAWRRWSKQNKNEESNNPLYNRYAGWEW